MMATGEGAATAPFFHQVPVLCAPGFAGTCRQTVAEWGLACLGESALPPPADYHLWMDSDGLSLRASGPDAPGPVRCEFAGGAARHRRRYGGGKSQAIAKAVGLRDKNGLVVVDLTAGLGSDAFVLAGLGARVLMVERHAVAAALLADGLRRAREAAAHDAELADVLGRLELKQQDARDWLAGQAGNGQADVIYLDPMFPEKRKSARVKKEMQAFQAVVGRDDDADFLLPLALDCARYRVVVKRPSRAPFLADRKPGYSLTGKSVRFDVYPLRRLA